MAKKDVDPKVLLKQYLADKTKVIRFDYVEDGFRKICFIVAEKITEENVQRKMVEFRETEDGINVYRYSERFQRFLCIGGPHDGERLASGDSPDYLVFNKAVFSRGESNQDILKAVLIYKPLVTIP